MRFVTAIRSRFGSASRDETVTLRAWNRYSAAVYWVTHAESKAIAALTATAFVVIGSVTIASAAEGVPAKMAALFSVVAGLVAAINFSIALLPRLGEDGPGESSIYFGHIVENYALGTGDESFVSMFEKGTRGGPAEIKDLAGQVHANAHIASAKYGWVSKGLRWLVLSIMAAIVAAVSWAWAIVVTQFS